MARTATKPASASAATAPVGRRRPPEPQRYAATADELLTFYREMVLIRRFEERAGQMYGMGLIGGFCTSTSARRRS